MPAGVAYAGQRSNADLAAETSSSIFQASSTTNAPPALGADTTTAPTTAPAPAPTTTEAPPVTEPPTTAPAVTEAPATTTPPTTAAPVPAATTPPTTSAPVAPPTTAAPTYVRSYPTASREEWEKAMAFAHIVKTQQEADWAAAHPAGEPAPPPEPAPVPSDDPLQTLSIYDQQFFQCVRWRESRGNYGAVNSSSGAGGAYQMLQSTWNNTAAHAGRGDLIGMRPNYASVYDQDFLAVHLLKWYGRSPWAGPGC